MLIESVQSSFVFVAARVTTTAVALEKEEQVTTTPIRELDRTKILIGPTLDPSYSNGSYYYSNPNGSTYYNNGKGSSTYTSPSGQTYTKSS